MMFSVLKPKKIEVVFMEEVEFVSPVSKNSI